MSAAVNNKAVMLQILEKLVKFIDFKEIKMVRIVTRSEQYIGGIDMNGHEKRDNYAENTHTVRIYDNKDTEASEVCAIVRSEDDEFETYMSYDEAVREIIDALHKSDVDSDIKVFIDYSDDQSEWLNTAKVSENVYQMFIKTLLCDIETQNAYISAIKKSYEEDLQAKESCIKELELALRENQDMVMSLQTTIRRHNSY